MTDRMTLTDVAAHIQCSRPTAYVLAGMVGFPTRGLDRKWSRSEVLDWLADNTKTVDAVSVAGVLVVRT